MKTLNLTFEWDEKKRLKNIRKHRLDFLDAWYVFQDSNAKIYIDKNNHLTEERYILFGINKQGKVNILVYTLRCENIRIISFRTATKKEAEEYYGN